MVLEAYVAQLFTAYLGRYISNLAQEAITVSMWKGNIELRNLELTRAALQHLGFPVFVHRGVIGYMRIDIPWTSMTSKSCEIAIDDVFVVVVPRTAIPWDDKSEEAERERAKKEQLDLYDAARNAKSERDKKESKTSFTARMQQTIFNNVKLNIRDVRIRYEDSVSLHTAKMYLSIQLRELEMVATNNRYEECFTPAGDGQLNYKVLSCSGLSVKINTVGSDKEQVALNPESVAMPPDEWRDYVLQVTTNPEVHDDGFVVPPSAVSVKLQIAPFDSRDVSIPRLSAQVDLRCSAITVSKDQYCCIRRVIHQLRFAEVLERGRRTRPLLSPTDAPREWWSHAINSVLTDIQVHLDRRHFSWDQYLMWKSMKHEYANLYLRHLKAKWLPELAPEDMERMQQLEAALSVHDITKGRDSAFYVLEKMASRVGSSGKLTRKQSNLKGGNSDDDDFVDKVFRSILTEELGLNVDLPPNYIMTHLTLTLPKGSIVFCAPVPAKYWQQFEEGTGAESHAAVPQHESTQFYECMPPDEDERGRSPPQAVPPVSELNVHSSKAPSTERQKIQPIAEYVLCHLEFSHVAVEVAIATDATHVTADVDNLRHIPLSTQASLVAFDKSLINQQAPPPFFEFAQDAVSCVRVMLQQSAPRSVWESHSMETRTADGNNIAIFLEPLKVSVNREYLQQLSTYFFPASSSRYHGKVVETKQEAVTEDLATAKKALRSALTVYDDSDDATRVVCRKLTLDMVDASIVLERCLWTHDSSGRVKGRKARLNVNAELTRDDFYIFNSFDAQRITVARRLVDAVVLQDVRASIAMAIVPDYVVYPRLQVSLSGGKLLAHTPLPIVESIKGMVGEAMSFVWDLCHVGNPTNNVPPPTGQAPTSTLQMLLPPGHPRLPHEWLLINCQFALLEVSDQQVSGRFTEAVFDWRQRPADYAFQFSAKSVESKDACVAGCSFQYHYQGIFPNSPLRCEDQGDSRSEITVKGGSIFINSQSARLFEFVYDFVVLLVYRKETYQVQLRAPLTALQPLSQVFLDASDVHVILLDDALYPNATASEPGPSEISQIYFRGSPSKQNTLAYRKWSSVSVMQCDCQDVILQRTYRNMADNQTPNGGLLANMLRLDEGYTSSFAVEYRKENTAVASPLVAGSPVFGAEGQMPLPNFRFAQSLTTKFSHATIVYDQPFWLHFLDYVLHNQSLSRLLTLSWRPYFNSAAATNAQLRAAAETRGRNRELLSLSVEAENVSVQFPVVTMVAEQLQKQLNITSTTNEVFTQCCFTAGIDKFSMSNAFDANLMRITNTFAFEGFTMLSPGAAVSLPPQGIGLSIPRKLTGFKVSASWAVDDNVPQSPSSMGSSKTVNAAAMHVKLEASHLELGLTTDDISRLLDLFSGGSVQSCKAPSKDQLMAVKQAIDEEFVGSRGSLPSSRSKRQIEAPNAARGESLSDSTSSQNVEAGAVPVFPTFIWEVSVVGAKLHVLHELQSGAGLQRLTTSMEHLDCHFTWLSDGRLTSECQLLRYRTSFGPLKQDEKSALDIVAITPFEDSSVWSRQPLACVTKILYEPTKRLVTCTATCGSVLVNVDVDALQLLVSCLLRPDVKASFMRLVRSENALAAAQTQRTASRINIGLLQSTMCILSRRHSTDVAPRSVVTATTLAMEATLFNSQILGVKVSEATVMDNLSSTPLLRRRDKPAEGEPVVPLISAAVTPNGLLTFNTAESLCITVSYNTIVALRQVMLSPRYRLLTSYLSSSSPQPISYCAVMSQPLFVLVIPSSVSTQGQLQSVVACCDRLEVSSGPRASGGVQVVNFSLLTSFNDGTSNRVADDCWICKGINISVFHTAQSTLEAPEYVLECQSPCVLQLSPRTYDAVLVAVASVLNEEEKWLRVVASVASKDTPSEAVQPRRRTFNARFSSVKLLASDAKLSPIFLFSINELACHYDEAAGSAVVTTHDVSFDEASVSGASSLQWLSLPAESRFALVKYPPRNQAAPRIEIDCIIPRLDVLLVPQASTTLFDFLVMPFQRRIAHRSSNDVIRVEITEDTVLNEDLVVAADLRIVHFLPNATNHITLDLNRHSLRVENPAFASSLRGAIVFILEEGITVKVINGLVCIPAPVEGSSAHSRDPTKCFVPFSACGEGSYIYCANEGRKKIEITSEEPQSRKFDAGPAITGTDVQISCKLHPCVTMQAQGFQAQTKMEMDVVMSAARSSNGKQEINGEVQQAVISFLQPGVLPAMLLKPTSATAMVFVSPITEGSTTSERDNLQKGPTSRRETVITCPSLELSASYRHVQLLKAFLAQVAEVVRAEKFENHTERSVAQHITRVTAWKRGLKEYVSAGRAVAGSASIVLNTPYVTLELVDDRGCVGAPICVVCCQDAVVKLKYKGSALSSDACMTMSSHTYDVVHCRWVPLLRPAYVSTQLKQTWELTHTVFFQTTVEECDVELSPLLIANAKRGVGLLVSLAAGGDAGSRGAAQCLECPLSTISTSHSFSNRSGVELSLRICSSTPNGYDVDVLPPRLLAVGEDLACSLPAATDLYLLLMCTLEECKGVCGVARHPAALRVDQLSRNDHCLDLACGTVVVTTIPQLGQIEIVIGTPFAVFNDSHCTFLMQIGNTTVTIPSSDTSPSYVPLPLVREGMEHCTVSIKGRSEKRPIALPALAAPGACSSMVAPADEGGTVRFSATLLSVNAGGRQIRLRPALRLVNSVGAGMYVQAFQPSSNKSQSFLSDTFDSAGEKWRSLKRSMPTLSSVPKTAQTATVAMSQLANIASVTLQHGDDHALLSCDLSSALYITVFIEQANGEPLSTLDPLELLNPSMVDAAAKCPVVELKAKLRDARGTAFYVQMTVDLVQFTVRFHVSYWLFNQTSLPIFITDSPLTKGLVAGLSPKAGVKPMEACKPFLLGSRNADNLSTMALMVGSDSVWSESITVEFGAEGTIVCAVPQQHHRVRCVHYSVQWPDVTSHTPPIINVNPRFVFVNSAPFPLRLRLSSQAADHVTSPSPFKRAVRAVVSTDTPKELTCVLGAKGTLAVVDLPEEAKSICLQKAEDTPTFRPLWSQPCSIEDVSSRVVVLWRTAINPKQAPVKPPDEFAVVSDSDMADEGAQDDAFADDVMDATMRVAVYMSQGSIVVSMKPLTMAPVLVENRVAVTIFLRQECSCRRVAIPPKQSCPYQWDDPEDNLVLTAKIGVFPGEYKLDFTSAQCQYIVSEAGGEGLGVNVHLRLRRSFDNKRTIVTFVEDEAIDMVMGEWRMTWSISLQVKTLAITLLRDESMVSANRRQATASSSRELVHLFGKDVAFTATHADREEAFVLTCVHLQGEDWRVPDRHAVVLFTISDPSAQPPPPKKVHVDYGSSIVACLRRVVSDGGVEHLREAVFNVPPIRVACDDTLIVDLHSCSRALKMVAGRTTSVSVEKESCELFLRGITEQAHASSEESFGERRLVLELLSIRELRLVISLQRSTLAPGTSRDPLHDLLGMFAVLIPAINNAEFSWPSTEEEQILATLWTVLRSTGDSYLAVARKQWPKLTSIGNVVDKVANSQSRIQTAIFREAPPARAVKRDVISQMKS